MFSQTQNGKIWRWEFLKQDNIHQFFLTVKTTVIVSICVLKQCLNSSDYYINVEVEVFHETLYYWFYVKRIIGFFDCFRMNKGEENENKAKAPKLPQMLLMTQWYFLAIYFPWIRLHQDAGHWEVSWRQTPPPGAGGTEQLSLRVFTPSTQLTSDPSCCSWGNTAAESSGSLLFPLRQNSGFWEALHLGKSGGKG